MDIDGYSYLQGVVKIEVEKVRGRYSDFVRVRIRGQADAMSFVCWGVPAADDEYRLQQPEVIIIEKDEREPADACDEHSEETDR